jgi:hypothetical protein
MKQFDGKPGSEIGTNRGDGQTMVDSSRLDGANESFVIGLMARSMRLRSNRRQLTRIAKKCERQPSVSTAEIRQWSTGSSEAVLALLEMRDSFRRDDPRLVHLFEKRFQFNRRQRRYFRTVASIVCLTIVATIALALLCRSVGQAANEAFAIVSEFELQDSDSLVSQASAQSILFQDFLILGLVLTLGGYAAVRFIAGRSSVSLLLANLPWLGVSYRNNIATEVFSSLYLVLMQDDIVPDRKSHEDEHSSTCDEQILQRALLLCEEPIARQLIGRIGLDCRAGKTLSAALADLTWFPKWVGGWLLGMSVARPTTEQSLFLAETLASQAELEFDLFAKVGNGLLVGLTLLFFNFVYLQGAGVVSILSRLISDLT